MCTLKPLSNGPLYSNAVIGILAVDGWAFAFGTARRGLGGRNQLPLYQLKYHLMWHCNCFCSLKAYLRSVCVRFSFCVFSVGSTSVVELLVQFIVWRDSFVYGMLSGTLNPVCSFCHCDWCCAGCRASAVPVEQRVPSESDRREPVRRDANHVPGAVPRVEGALESGDLDARLQRPQNVHGDERHALRGTHC